MWPHEVDLTTHDHMQDHIRSIPHLPLHRVWTEAGVDRTHHGSTGVRPPTVPDLGMLERGGTEGEFQVDHVTRDGLGSSLHPL